MTGVRSSLVITCVDDGSFRRVQNNGSSIDDTMLHPHKLEGEVLGQGILLPVFQGKQLVVHPEFLFTCYLLPYQLNRIRGPDDRGMYR